MTTIGKTTEKIAANGLKSAGKGSASATRTGWRTTPSGAGIGLTTAPTGTTTVRTCPTVTTTATAADSGWARRVADSGSGGEDCGGRDDPPAAPVSSLQAFAATRCGFLFFTYPWDASSAGPASAVRHGAMRGPIPR